MIIKKRIYQHTFFLKQKGINTRKVGLMPTPPETILASSAAETKLSTLSLEKKHTLFSYLVSPTLTPSSGKHDQVV